MIWKPDPDHVKDREIAVTAMTNDPPPENRQRAAMPAAIIDSHHHLWEIGRFPYKWLAPDAPPRPFGDHSAIKSDYLPTHYRSDTTGLPIVATVHVQANNGAADPSSETEWLTTVAQTTGLPDAVVGSANLAAPDIAQILQSHRRFEIFRGIRTLAAYEEDDPWHFADRPHILREKAFLDGAEALTRLGLSLDLVIVAGQMPEVAELAQQFPDLSIIVDHLAMPRPGKPGDISRWKEGLQALAETRNVSTKLSGLWTIDRNWRPEVLKPFVEEVVNGLGQSRVMYGSNLPIEKLMCPARTQIENLMNILEPMGPDVVASVFYENARRIYKLGTVDLTP